MPLARREMQDALVGFRLLRTSAEPSSKTTTSTQLPLVMLSELLVHCPLYALVCDLETAPGFGDFIQQFSAKERLRRIGQRCHLMPDFNQGSSRTGNSEY